MIYFHVLVRCILPNPCLFVCLFVSVSVGGFGCVGDVVLVHPDLAHAGGPNHTSGGVRMMVYFRVKV